MKKLTFLLAAISILSISNAQITFEYEYDSLQAPDVFYLSQIGDNFYRYISFDDGNNQFKLYDLNHSLDKTISIPMENGFPNLYTSYISQSLFDTDVLIEFMVIYSDSAYCYHKLKVLNESGSVLLEVDSTHTGIVSSAGNDGFVLIIKKHTDCPNRFFGRQIYSLPGSLPTGKTEINRNLDNWQISNSYPNPSSNYTRIDYQLPKNIYDGEVVFYDIHGREVKRFKVDRTFNHLRLSTTDLSPGTYYYNLQTSQGVSSGKKMVVIK